MLSIVSVASASCRSVYSLLNFAGNMISSSGKVFRLVLYRIVLSDFFANGQIIRKPFKSHLREKSYVLKGF